MMSIKHMGRDGWPGRRAALYVLCLVFSLLFAASCGRPRTIGRDELKQIFKEAFLINAYYDMKSPDLSLDSLDIYGPVLERRGYKVVDLEYTVNNFARKKSAKLSDVIEQAITELDVETVFYDSRVALVDTLDALAARAFRREVFHRDSIIARRVADTAKLRVMIPVDEGSYEVSYSYFIDSLDKNRNLRATFMIRDSAGKYLESEVEYLSSRFARRRPAMRTMVADSMGAKLEMVFGGYPRHELTAPHIRIDSLSVVYYLPRKVALDSMGARWNKLGRYDYQAYSGALRPNAPWVDTLASGGVR